MFEKVNPCHPDKVADRIAGAVVDMAYARETDPKIAVEVLIGHGVCHIIAETSTSIDRGAISEAVHRIAGNLLIDYVEVPQDSILAGNQSKYISYSGSGSAAICCTLRPPQSRSGGVIGSGSVVK